MFTQYRSSIFLADRSAHLVVTSPPYWQLKDYGTDYQIGFHESYESYINNLNLVWNECERVLLQSPPKSRKSAQPLRLG
ncbi:MAG: DNA methyltransferase [Chlorobium sp.]